MTESTEPRSLKARLGALLETLLNQALALDPESPNEIGALHGRSLTLTWNGPEWALRLWVDQNRLKVGPAQAASSDLNLRSTLSGLIGLLRPEAAHSLPVGRVEISGDAELLRRIERLGKRFDPDWDAAFAARFGSVLGPQLARHLRAALHWVNDSAHSLAESSAEYLQEESRDLVSAAELDLFGSEIDTLRDGVDRFDAKLKALARRRQVQNDV
ncbi:MAG: SCP2 domain-containing protein [Lysobacterales bacterium CG02_land_8_20_14_3_00_62_12]|nr:MAG: SCP2 domain-containing protein [Xanthomonadales bacterium CG02_land_8_20_14_3_00_62_12]